MRWEYVPNNLNLFADMKVPFWLEINVILCYSLPQFIAILIYTNLKLICVKHDYLLTNSNSHDLCLDVLCDSFCLLFVYIMIIVHNY